MKNFFRQHPETTLGVLALFFIGTILWSFIWGIGVIAGEVNRAMNPSIGAQSVTMFDLQDAQSLNLRGLVKPAP